MKTVRISTLSQHHQHQLREILQSVGVEILPQSQPPLVLRIVNDARSRSVTPGRSAGPPNQKKIVLNQVMEFFNDFFQSFASQFRHLHTWHPKLIAPVPLVGKLDALISYIAEGLRKESKEVVLGGLVMKHFQERLGLRSLIEHNLLDVLWSCFQHHKAVMEIDIFVRIINGFYDATDILFLDYVKQMMPRPARQLVLDDCALLTSKIFGAEQQHVGDSVMGTLGSEVDQRSATIDPSYYVYICVWVFHHQRMDLDMRTSVHGFEDSVKKNRKNTNLIDNYIDSILSLKEARRSVILSQATEAGGGANKSTESLKLESLIESVLADCCAKLGADLPVADRLMQEILTGGKVGGMGDCVIARNELFLAVENQEDQSQIESKLIAFCTSVAAATTDRSYF